MNASSLPPTPDRAYAAACQARDRFWAQYGGPDGPCCALGLRPEHLTYVLEARVGVDADRARLPATFEGFAVQAQVGDVIPQER